MSPQFDVKHKWIQVKVKRVFYFSVWRLISRKNSKVHFQSFIIKIKTNFDNVIKYQEKQLRKICAQHLLKYCRVLMSLQNWVYWVWGGIVSASACHSGCSAVARAYRPVIYSQPSPRARSARFSGLRHWCDLSKQRAWSDRLVLVCCCARWYLGPTRTHILLYTSTNTYISKKIDM